MVRKIISMSLLASRAMRETAPPCIVQMQRFLQEIKPPPLSLAQGIVYWTPPQVATEAAKVRIL